MSHILKLVEFARIDKSNTDKQINFSSIPNTLSKKIFDDTGVTVKGCFKILSSFGIRHVFNNHYDSIKENLSNQVAVNDNDFELLPDILEFPDSVIKGNTSSNGRSNSVVFIKKINNLTYHVPMRLTQGNLVMVTMYIKK